jgi:hypothetical protein
MPRRVALEHSRPLSFKPIIAALVDVLELRDQVVELGRPAEPVRDQMSRVVAEELADSPSHISTSADVPPELQVLRDHPIDVTVLVGAIQVVVLTRLIPDARPRRGIYAFRELPSRTTGRCWISS